MLPATSIASASRVYSQLRVPPQAIRPVVAHPVAVAAEEDADPAVAVSRVLPRELDHLRHGGCVLRRLPRLVAESRPCRPEQRARPSLRETAHRAEALPPDVDRLLAHAVLLRHVRHRGPVCSRRIFTICSSVYLLLRISLCVAVAGEAVLTSQVARKTPCRSAAPGAFSATPVSLETNVGHAEDRKDGDRSPAPLERLPAAPRSRGTTLTEGTSTTRQRAE
jgi:hypothetical protein